MEKSEIGLGFEAESERVPFTPVEEQAMFAIALERARQELSAVEEAATPEQEFYAQPAAAMAAWHLREIDVARSLAERVLLVAPNFRNNWNFGNAVNVGHNVLGLLALHDGRNAAAVLELHKAGETPGSPQLNSFGPSMQLARALARQGEFPAALEYLAQCRIFWKRGNIWLALWEEKLQAGKVPNCFLHGFR